MSDLILEDVDFSLIESEVEELQEGMAKTKIFYLKGPFLQAEIQNGNKRIYPKSIIEREVEKYNKVISEKRSVGELLHPSNTDIDPSRISHLVTELKMDGNTAIGKAKILDKPAFPCGMIAKALVEEGIKIEFLTGPKKLVAENGKLHACEFIRMKMGALDESNRRRPEPIAGSEFTVELDTLIVSISESPDTSFLKNEKVELSKGETIVVNPETFETKRKGVFAGGDVVTGPNTVVDAVASGKIAAQSIEQYLHGEEIKREYKLTRPSMYIEPVKLTTEEAEELLTAKRPEPKQLSAKIRKTNFKEVEAVLTEKQAVKEAKRCLRCELETEDGKKFIEELKESKVTSQYIHR